MKKYILIGSGSFLGTICRYLLKTVHFGGFHEWIPLNTLMINVSGSLVLALILTVALEIWSFDPDLKLGITAGFVGAFTTFSTLCKETVGLMRAGNYSSAISYLAISAILGLGAAYLGTVLAKKLGAKYFRKKKPNHKPDFLMGAESEVK
ncbi:MAG: CrcB family protein [Oscillospiraceae bacterium]|nr:CrcB family protein [Oscillospiraceae bacterium]